MTDEIGIAITATNSGTEPGRIERLLDVLALVHSLLDRNVIDMADEGHTRGHLYRLRKSACRGPR